MFILSLSYFKMCKTRAYKKQNEACHIVTTRNAVCTSLNGVNEPIIISFIVLPVTPSMRYHRFWKHAGCNRGPCSGLQPIEAFYAARQSIGALRVQKGLSQQMKHQKAGAGTMSCSLSYFSATIELAELSWFYHFGAVYYLESLTFTIRHWMPHCFLSIYDVSEPWPCPTTVQ